MTAELTNAMNGIRQAESLCCRLLQQRDSGKGRGRGGRGEEGGGLRSAIWA